MSPKDVYSPIPIFFPVESVRHKTKQSTNTKRNTRNQPLQTHIITSTTAANWGIWCRCGIWLSAKYPLGRKKSLLNPLSPWIFSSLLPKESRFPSFPHSFRRSRGARGRSPSLQVPESHFNEFTSGCTRFYNRLKISGLRKLLHIRPVSKESECAAHFVTIWFTRRFPLPMHPEVNSLKAWFNILPTTCP